MCDGQLHFRLTLHPEASRKCFRLPSYFSRFYDIRKLFKTLYKVDVVNCIKDMLDCILSKPYSLTYPIPTHPFLINPCSSFLISHSSSHIFPHISFLMFRSCLAAAAFLHSHQTKPPSLQNLMRSTDRHRSLTVYRLNYQFSRRPFVNSNVVPGCCRRLISRKLLLTSHDLSSVRFILIWSARVPPAVSQSAAAVVVAHL